MRLGLWDGAKKRPCILSFFFFFFFCLEGDDEALPS